MKFRLYSTCLMVLMVALGLSACRTVPTAEIGQSTRIQLYQDRAGKLIKLDSWALQGRLAVSDDEDGGSGTFQWQKSGGSNRMDFHGALGRGAWSLTTDNGGAELTLADGTFYRADTIEELVRDELGWDVPVETLSWWVRGLAAPGEIQHRVLDNEGRLSELRQHDWTVEYGRFREVGGLQLPIKLTARQVDRSVKLAIRKWELTEGQETRE